MNSIRLKYLHYFKQYAKMFKIDITGFKAINNVVIAVFLKVPAYTKYKGHFNFFK